MSTEAQQILHVAHTVHDEDWVQGVLVPALGLSDEQVWTCDEADPGSLKLEELERAVTSHRYTLLVVSSAARVDQWTQFAARLAEHLGVEEDKPRLLLAALDFEPGSERARELVPLGQRCLDCFDFSSPDRTAAALARLAAQLKVAAAPEPPTECPYPGLRMFGADGPGSFHRTDLFFGRDEEGRAIVDRLRRGGRVLLVGPSGCGKSSLVRARVLPALVQGEGAMAYAVARPGAQPDAALRAALAALDPRLVPATDAYLAAADAKAARATLAEATAGPARLLFLDQFEEVFQDGAEAHAEERARAFARLAALGHVPGLAILLNMRADFYGDLMHSPAWDDFKDHRVELAPLRGAALRQAIARPAEAVGVYVEPDLVERLVREADQDRAAEALPLLQVALEQLWPLREWRYLSLASYERLAEGERRGLDVVLARHADQCIAALPEPLQILARRVLIDLVQLGEGRPDTRRRRTASELRRAGDDDRALAQVLDHLSQQRLIVISAEATAPAAAPSSTTWPAVVTERHIDLAHDTLITGWPALTGWIARRRDDLRTQRRLEARAAGGGLLAGSELPELTRWVAHIATPEGQAIGASEALLALVRRSLAARRARRIALVTGLVALIAVLSVATTVSLWQRGIARDQAEEAERQRTQAETNAKEANAEKEISKRLLVRSAQVYQEIGRQLVAGSEYSFMKQYFPHQEDGPFAAVLYLVEARRAGADNASLRTLFSAAIHQLPALIIEHRDAVHGATFSPDGRRVISVGKDQLVHIWDASTGKEIESLHKHSGSINRVSFNSDGSRFVTASDDQTARVWSILDGKLVSDPFPHHDKVKHAVFSPDGTQVATASGATVHLWGIGNNKQPLRSLELTSSANSVEFSADGRLLITADAGGAAQIWDARKGQPIGPAYRHADPVHGARFSADGKRFVTASGSNARIWNVGSKKPTLELTHTNSVQHAAFSPDEMFIVTAGEGKTAQIWDIKTKKSFATPLTHQASITSAAFSSDGKQLVTSSADMTARIWSTSSLQESVPVTALKHSSPVTDAFFGLDGERLITVSKGGAVQAWNAITGQAIPTHFKHARPPKSSAQILVSFDGARGSTLDADHNIWTWNNAALGSPTAQQPLPELDTIAPHLVASSDGARVALAMGHVHLWNGLTGEYLGELSRTSMMHSATFSPDGSLLATMSGDDHARSVEVWDVEARKHLATFDHEEMLARVAFSHDGKQLITMGLRSAVFWDVATRNPLYPRFSHDGLVGASSSLDGTLAVTANAEELRIWHTSSGKRLLSLFPRTSDVAGVAFSRDGRRVATRHSDDTVKIWTLSVEQDDDWERALARTPFILEHGVPKLRASLAARPGNQPAGIKHGGE